MLCGPVKCTNLCAKSMTKIENATTRWETLTMTVRLSKDLTDVQKLSTIDSMLMLQLENVKRMALFHRGTIIVDFKHGRNEILKQVVWKCLYVYALERYVMQESPRGPDWLTLML